MATTTETNPEAGQLPAIEVESSFYAVFKRGSRLFALDVDLVREVLPGQSLTRVPRAGEQILGVLNLRGEILPVMTLDPQLGLTNVVDNSALPILVLRKGELLVGLRVDSVQGTVSIPTQEIQPHPSAGENQLLSGFFWREGQSSIALIGTRELLETFYQQATKKQNA
jgi:purine-binding chemotaxis protein CheW